MGILSDINYSKGAYGKKAGQIDITKTPDYFNEVNTRANMGYQFGTMVIGSLFNIAGAISENCGGSGSSSNSSSGQTCTEIKDAIEAIQLKYGCKTVDELAAKYQTASNLQQQFNAKGGKERLEAVINSIGSDTSSGINAKILAVDGDIEKLEGELRACFTTNPPKDKTYNQIQSELLQKQQEKSRLLGELKTLESEKNNLVGLEQKFNDYLKNNGGNITLADFAKDVEKFRQLEQNLRRLEGRDAVESFKTDDAKSITKILNALRTETDTNKKAELEVRLKEALQKYVDNHGKSNQTFVNLAEQYGVKVQ